MKGARRNILVGLARILTSRAELFKRAQERHPYMTNLHYFYYCAQYIFFLLCFLVPAVNSRFESLCPGDNNVRIDGLPMPMRDISSVSSLWLIPIRFVGPTAFSAQPNPVGELRCQIFARLTLPSIVAAVSNAPPKTRVRVVLINDSVITEPTCARVVNQAKKDLGSKLGFGSDTQKFLSQFTLDEDVLFISRFDSDDGVGPDILKDIHSTFLKANLPVAILSPFYGNLWYPFAGNGSCGQMIYNAMVRKFPIFQTHAYDKAQLKAIMGLGPGNKLLEFFQTREGKYFMPYGYGHKHPDEFFAWFREKYAGSPILKTWPCGTSDQCVSECHLFFFTASSKGILGSSTLSLGCSRHWRDRGARTSTHSSITKTTM